jgi:hypothetical protein
MVIVCLSDVAASACTRGSLEFMKMYCISVSLSQDVATLKNFIISPCANFWSLLSFDLLIIHIANVKELKTFDPALARQSFTCAVSTDAVRTKSVGIT